MHILIRFDATYVLQAVDGVIVCMHKQNDFAEKIFSD